MASHSSHHPQEVLHAQFSLYVHKGGVKPDLNITIVSKCSRTPGDVAAVGVYKISLTCRNYNFFSQREITSEEQQAMGKHETLTQ